MRQSTMLRLMKLLCLFGLLAGLTGCATTQDEESFDASVTRNYQILLKNVQNSVKYDPYSNAIHYDINQIQAYYNSYLNAVSNETGLMGIWGPMTVAYPENYINTTDRYVAADYAQANGGTLAAARLFAANNGWVITRAGYNVDGKGYAGYEVPILFIGSIGWRGEKWYPMATVFNITYKSQHGVQDNAVAAPAGKTSSNADKLKSLYELYKSGVLTKKEYEQKKKQLLESY
ncbi:MULTISPECIES: SHOCT domain-containing protein [unclassified Paludibacterium]|uniref:SHOCT domain-containing protein n=1 Tax=unclassified Paludibacterium TaxID=2618429 RepID=UPI001C040142|nr:SHOCT domain-containing protein [Paludibacterium sp. B53371]BEV72948.1 hypothetical protein THUN1379_24300 [Paludibacterium sp. THUN1379]